jgi:hypothetical protein
VVDCIQFTEHKRQKEELNWPPMNQKHRITPPPSATTLIRRMVMNLAMVLLALVFMVVLMSPSLSGRRPSVGALRAVQAWTVRPTPTWSRANANVRRGGRCLGAWHPTTCVFSTTRNDDTDISSDATTITTAAATSAAAATIDDVPPTLFNMDDIIGLCKRRGFIFPSSEIYNGYAGFYDYGPMGVEMKRAVKDLWWRTFVTSREDVVGLDSSIIHNPMTWQNSGMCL